MNPTPPVSPRDALAPLTLNDVLQRMAALAPSALTKPTHPSEMQDLAKEAEARGEFAEAAKMWDVAADAWEFGRSEIRGAIARGLAMNAREKAQPVTLTITIGPPTSPCVTCGSPVARAGNQCISCAIAEAHTATAWDGDELCEACEREPHTSRSTLCETCGELDRMQRCADVR